MKTLKKSILLLASLVVAVSAASCINDELTEPQKEMAVKELATVDEQAASMEATLADLEALLTSAEGLDDELASVVSSIENHIADLKAGATLLDGTLATLERQKELAEVMAAIEFGAEATKGGAALTKAVASVDKRAESWLGKHFAAYYPAAKAEASAAARLAALDLKTQKISVEAILSDVEAGLRKDADKEELTALAAKIDSNADEVAELLAALAATRTEVETEYAETVETAVTDPSGFDLPALKQFNSAVAGTLAEADNSLAGLIARVEACEAQLEDIRTRLGALESTVTDLNELLDLIQSVTFMSEYSAENAIAYYTLGSESRADGKKVRNHQGTIDLRYVIRPAGAAQALTDSDLWDNEVKVFGYYANTITKAAPETFDFDITNVTADEAGNGIVTVTVSAATLSESFYFKETGAKLALSIATGKTDLTSKFVEIVPKDASNTVYVEDIELSAKSIEIDNGTKADLEAYITPDNVTVGGVTWTTSDANVVSVTENGVIEGMSVGSAVITATTKGTDEWGNTIQAQCNVKVNPAIKLSGPSYVEEGGNITIRIESPDYIDPESVTWTSSAPTMAAITKTDDGNALISGEAMYFNTTDKAYTPITITCDIDGKATLSHEIRVIAVQPWGISINGLSDAENQVSTKVGTPIGLYGTMKPDGVSTEYFKLSYLGASEGYFAANNVGTTTVTVSIQNGGTGQYSYFYPKGKNISRNITVVVEPCYVESISLPATHDMLLDQTATLPVTLISDVGGMDPTYPDLIWTSSAPEIVSINETTGEMTSLKEGTATVTATTSHADAVPSGQAQKSASCVVTVKKPTAPIAIGDYYYSDGTWSTERDNSKTVVGIVFSKVGATTTDTKLAADHPQCYNGLVVSLEEASTAWQSSAQNVSSWVTTNLSYGDLRNYDKTNGYSNTIALKAYNEQNSASKVLAVDGTAPSAGAPGLSSGWYLPSYKELSLLAESYATIKDKLASVGTALDATTPNYNIGGGGSADTYRYWASTESSSSSSWGCCVQFSNCSMMSNQSKNKTYYRVRYILAF